MPWELSDLDLASIHWICLKGVPLLFWHDHFFFVGVELGGVGSAD